MVNLQCIQRCLKDIGREKYEMLTKIEVYLILILGMFVTITILGNIDAGLYSSLYCAEHGETQECFERLKNAN